MAPVEGLRARPFGRPFADQVKGGVPPCAVIWEEYDTPIVASGRVVLGVMVNGAGFTVKAKDLVAVAPVLSLT